MSTGCATGAEARGDEADIGAGWYVAALVGYVVAGFFLRSVLLNWIVGPLFLLIVLYLVPTRLRRWTARLRGAKLRAAKLRSAKQRARSVE